VASECAVALGALIEREMGVRVRYFGDVYHTLSKPVLSFHNEAVRALTLADLDLLEPAPIEL